MSAESLKLKYSLLDKLISITDESLLRKIDVLMGNVDVDHSVFKVSDAQKKMLKCSENDLNAGHIMTDEALNSEEDAWLNG